LAADRWQILLPGHHPSDRQRIGRIGLAALSQPTAFPNRQRRGHLDHDQPGLQQAHGHNPPVAAGTFDADSDQTRLGLQPHQQPAVTVAGVGEALGLQLASCAVHDADRQGVFVAVHSDEHVAPFAAAC